MTVDTPARLLRLLAMFTTRSSWSADELAGRHPSLAGIGIGVGGLVEHQAVVGESPFLLWRDVPLAGLVEERTGLPVVVENDVAALVEAETWFGAGRGLDRFVVLTIGAGLGYGLVGSNEFEEAFLDEGFTEYWGNEALTGTYPDDLGRLAGRAVEIWQLERLSAGGAARDAPLAARPSYALLGANLNAQFYTRPALTLKTLENRFGRTVLDRVFQSYFARWRFRHPRFEDFVAVAREAGGDDVESGEEGHTIYCDPDELHQVAKALEARFGEPRAVQITWRPKTDVPIDEETGQKLLRMIDGLEDLDDVQNVYANFDIAEDVLAKLTAA